MVEEAITTILFTTPYIVLILYFILFIAMFLFKQGISSLVFILYNLFCAVFFYRTDAGAVDNMMIELFFIFMLFIGLIEFLRRMREG